MHASRTPQAQQAAPRPPALRPPHPPAAAAHRHNEARPLLRDGVVIALQRMEELAAIKSSIVGLARRCRWGMRMSHLLWEKVRNMFLLASSAA